MVDLRRLPAAVLLVDEYHMEELVPSVAGGGVAIPLEGNKGGNSLVLVLVVVVAVAVGALVVLVSIEVLIVAVVAGVGTFPAVAEVAVVAGIGMVAAT